MPDPQDRVSQLYAEALARTVTDRADFLRRACAGDEALRVEVESLLAHASDPPSILDAPLGSLAAAVLPASGTSLIGRTVGGYQILSALGAGGMGEVYRARDAKLGRDVAIKILPRAFANDQDRLSRFDREARVLASLNHPHIGAIYGLDAIDGTPALVLELIEGDTLAERIAKGPLPVASALTIATQMAEALEAAHERGIIHRDLKPANIKITPAGVVKVLDFGLAKAVAGDASSADLTQSPTLTVGGTADGVMLGTVTYMSPEQARGKPVDKRTDIWAFGCVLYEMLTERAAFSGETVSDIIASILGRDPDLAKLPGTTPASIRRLLQRCLEKDAGRRLHDIADARIEIDDALATPAPSAEESHTRPRARTRPPWLVSGMVAAAGMLAVGAAYVARPRAPDALPAYHQLTFRRGSISGAQFTPDGQTIVYSAAWERPPMRLFSTRADSLDTSSLPLPEARLLSVSRSGRMAIALGGDIGGRSTLAEVSLAGQVPRELLNDVLDADWAPSGDALVVTHLVNGRMRLEYPVGTVLYDPGRLILSPRFSPKGDLIAFIEFVAGSAIQGLTVARISVVDLSGHVRVVSQGWEMFGLAWSPNGDEIWFSARDATSRSGGPALHAVTLSGRHRVVAAVPGILLIKQISSDGRVLLSHEQWPVTMVCQAPGTTGERDLSWLDFSEARDISADGRFVLFDEGGLAEGSKGGVYLRRFDGSAAVRIGEGQALALSPDVASAVTLEPSNPGDLRIIPTGPGQARIVRGEGLTYLDAKWFPDGTRLLVVAQEPTRSPSLFVQDVAGGAPRRLVEGTAAGAISPDGRLVATVGTADFIVLTPVDGGQPRMLSGVPAGTSILRWESTGRYLFLKAYGELAVKILRFDIETGRAEPWRTLAPSDLAGVNRISDSIALAPDGQSYCNSYVRNLSSLFVVDGLK